MHRKVKKTAASFLVMGMLVSVISATAMQAAAAGDPQEKLAEDLKTQIAQTEDPSEKIPVYVWLKDIDQAQINDKLKKEKNMDPALYEDREQFEAVLVPQIAKPIEDRVGYAEAHRKKLNETLSNAEKLEQIGKLEQADKAQVPGPSAGAVQPESVQDAALPADDGLAADEPMAENAQDTLPAEKTEQQEAQVDKEGFDGDLSLVDRAVNAQTDKYMMAKRELKSEAYIEKNERFLRNSVRKDDVPVLYNSKMSSTLILELTGDEILALAEKPEVEGLSLYEEVIAESDMDIVTGQVRADDTSGTKAPGVITNSGLKGTGVKVGVIEFNEGGGEGRYDPDAPMLKGLAKSRLNYVKNDCAIDTSTGKPLTGKEVESAVGDHATVVVSEIIGSKVNMENKNYEGIVPNATLIQTSSQYGIDLFYGIYMLATKGATVINISMGFRSDGQYGEIDREVDRLIQGGNITIVKSAGNNAAGYGDKTDTVSSPGLGYNVITVGNLQTKSSPDYRDQFYTPNESSSWKENSKLTNKPDVSAPGTMIKIPKYQNINRYYYENGYSCSGTSFSAPIVTGIAAQLMQVDGWLKYNPTTVKSLLVLGAHSTGASSDDIAKDDNNSSKTDTLLEKRGAGMVDAFASARIAAAHDTFSVPFNLNTTEQSSYSFCFSPNGGTIRFALCFSMADDQTVDSINSKGLQNNVDLEIYDDITGKLLEYSRSTKNNVEIIEINQMTSHNPYGLLRVEVKLKSHVQSDDKHYKEVKTALSWNGVTLVN